MNNYEKPYARSTGEVISQEIKTISNNPFLDSILKSVSGLVAVLDTNRQILAVNYEMLHSCGIENPDDILGMRPGEALHCIHSSDTPEGCGTSDYCASCGAAIAMVTALQNNSPCDKTCAIQIKKNGKIIDLCFLVSAFPVEYADSKYILLFMRDVTNQQRWAAVESVFFHDLNNLLAILMGVTELYEMENTPFSDKVHSLTMRIKNEIDIQRVLTKERADLYTLAIRDIYLSEIIKDIQNSLLNHSCSFQKHLKITGDTTAVIQTDYTILMKILTNLLINAFEASKINDTVKLSFETIADKKIFRVWNAACIPEKIKLRIFQRNFSTKEGDGRGLGTYSVKLFTEQFLGGTVSFSSDESGTEFIITLL